MNKIGSHNSWSYAPIKQWYIPAFVCKCQNVDIKEQYMRGVKVFDLRVRRYKGNWYTAHGSACFLTDYIDDLHWLNNQKDSISVRIILEYNSKPKNLEDIKILFRNLCRYLEIMYDNINFFGGKLKYTWETLYTFNGKDIPLIDKYSSTTSLFKTNNKFLKIIDDWWPYLYAKLYNKKNYEEYMKSPHSDCLFIDFIDFII
jgi:hypothetical protein